MATKHISGSYPGGYYLNPTYQTLVIDPTAVVGGAGVTASAAQPSTINNLGKVQGTSNGISLGHGGKVTNGDATNTTAVISGIVISGYAGTIINNGTISDLGPNNASIFLVDGGTVINGSESNTAAYITNGIALPAPATIFNFGTIASGSNNNFPTIGVSAGGTIVNGSATSSAAYIKNGIVFTGPGSITNFGTITGDIILRSSDASLILEGTGVHNGATEGSGGTLELGAKAGPGTLSGLGSSIVHFATIGVDKFATWSLSGPSSIAAGTALKNAGTLDLLGQVVNSGKITNLAGATLAFEGDVSITTDPAVKAGQFTNAGLVEKLLGTGTSIIRTGTASLTDTGTIDVQTGTLELTGQTVTVAGLIKGAGTIEFGPGNITLTTLATGASIKTAGMKIAGSGAHVTVGRSLGYSGAFAAGANTELTIAGGDLLQLTGSASFSKDTVDGAGRITTKGAMTLSQVLFGGTGQWRNAGTVSETGQLTLGDVNGQGAVFVNQAGGVFDIAGNSGIDGTAPSATFQNAGLLEKTVGAKSSIGVALVNTGTVEATSGTLDLQKAVTGNGGTLKIDAGKAIQADAAVSGGQTVDFNGGGDKLVLTDATHFAGKLSNFAVGDMLDLRQFDPATATLGFAENAAMTQGTLTVTDGALVAKITLLGQYMASGFNKASDGVGGINVTYTPQAAAALAPPHT
jgi:hypothetical protein